MIDQAPPFRPIVVVDGRLVTGQDPASASKVAAAAAKVACSEAAAIAD